MKKFIVVTMVIASLFVLASCSKDAATASSGSQAVTSTGGTSASAPTVAPAPSATLAAASTTTPSTGTVDSEYNPNTEVSFAMQTSEANRIVTIGTIDKSLYEAPIFVTSFGQSTDAAMLDTVMKRVGVEYKYSTNATADDIDGYKTIIIAVGASTKGLGAAGISEADETARAQKIMKKIKDDGIQVICCHIGGSGRRGSLSDVFADMVMAQCSYIVLKEDANFDGKFTDYAKQHDLPISLIFSTKDTVSVFTDLLK